MPGSSGGRQRPRALRGRKLSQEKRKRITLITEEPMRPTTAESTIRALIATIDEQRLRALIVELPLAAWRQALDLPRWPRPPRPSNGRRQRALAAGNKPARRHADWK